jgi:hypothetical protein
MNKQNEAVENEEGSEVESGPQMNKQNEAVENEEGSEVESGPQMNKQNEAVENEEGSEVESGPQMISLKDICDELGIKTISARQKLRNKVTKGEGFRWEFTEEEAEAVRQLLSHKAEPKAPSEKKVRKSKKKAEPVADDEGSDEDDGE